MLYPILTIDTTEITADKPDENNNIRVYVEWVAGDDFENITYNISCDKELTIIDRNTNDEDKINHFTNLIQKMKNDIVDYVDERESELCLV